MNREYKKHFKTALNKLPQSNPDHKIWERIEGQLAFREQLTNASQHLPDYEPGEQIWQNIEKKLDHKTIKIFPVTYRYLSIAAGIAAIVVCTIIITHKNRETINETVEITDNEQKISTIESDSLTSQVFAFIDAQCKSSSYICRSQEFQDERQQLSEVNGELEKVNKTISTLGSSYSIIRTKTKLENIKAQLIKDLVKQVTS